MPTVKQTYRQFLQDNFAGLKLEVPLFYEWKYGLRFDLQNERNDTKFCSSDKYFAEVVRRASMLFEATFDSSDMLFFVCTEFQYRKRKIKLTNFAFRQINNLEKNEVYRTKETWRYEPQKNFNVAFIYLTANRINYKNILTAIGNAASSRLPSLDHKNIFFVNVSKKLIFHMYDDRGLDIIASDKETLRPIYNKYNDWILDYPREQIDEQFM